ncbi:hypothetical protein ACFQQB_29020 [Nonomuraea rubra]|uniref:hypothetical protein n=1 Tax=Nonomuraea rubra TaxID=46180 RepID=UPI003606D704
MTRTRTQTVADRLAVVANPACPPEILIILVDDPHWSVRWSLPDHPATGVEVRRAICRSADDVLRRLLAESGGLDAETNAALAADRSPDVRAGLAAHTDDPHLLATLQTDPAPEVRARAAENPSPTTTSSPATGWPTCGWPRCSGASSLPTSCNASPMTARSTCDGC